jgi:ATP synthase I subunit
METERPIEDEPASRVLRRIRFIGASAYVAFAVYCLISGGMRAFLGLTCSSAVVMINFLWLEEIVSNLLQPTPHPHAWRLTLRALARFALLGVALLVTIYVARFDPISVLLGFSIVVVGIMGEALYGAYRSFAG